MIIMNNKSWVNEREKEGEGGGREGMRKRYSSQCSPSSLCRCFHSSRWTSHRASVSFLCLICTDSFSWKNLSQTSWISPANRRMSRVSDATPLSLLFTDGLWANKNYERYTWKMPEYNIIGTGYCNSYYIWCVHAQNYCCWMKSLYDLLNQYSMTLRYRPTLFHWLVHCAGHGWGIPLLFRRYPLVGVAPGAQSRRWWGHGTCWPSGGHEATLAP